MIPPFEAAHMSDDHQPEPMTPDLSDLAVEDLYAVLDRLAEQGQAAPNFQPPVVKRPVEAPEVEHTQRREERLRTHTGGMETKLLLDGAFATSEVTATGVKVAPRASVTAVVKASQALAKSLPMQAARRSTS